jgi:superfamily II DNA or RNA helicase
MSEHQPPSHTTGVWGDRAKPASSPSLSSRSAEWGPVRIPELSPAASELEYQLHLAALEWALDPAIMIASAEDIQARKHWKDLLSPFEHQVRNLITFCRRAPVALIADDVGLGKTISAGLILSELIARKKVRRALIIAPKVLGPQWQEELAGKFRLTSEVLTGNEIRRAENGATKTVITTYQSARGRLENLAKAGFEMLILDEAHHLRNLHGGTSKEPPKIAVEILSVLRARGFRYVLMLTATPIQNRLWDIYSLIDLLTTAKGHQNPFGGPDDFARRYIGDSRATARQLNPGRRDEFRQHLSQYMVRTRRADCGLNFPNRTVSTHRAQPTAPELELRNAVARIFPKLNGLAQVSIAQALMSSPQALLRQLEGMARSADVVGEITGEVREIVRTMPDAGKLNEIGVILDQLRLKRPDDWRALIFTGRVETQTAIGDFIERRYGKGKVGFIRGGRATENRRDINRYTEEPPVCNVIVSTDAGAEGVNLQAGNVVINYDLPWNPMILEQRIGRVQRLGSKHAHVVVFNLVLAGSVEERVVGRLSEKLAAVSATIGDVEGLLETLGGDDDESTSFQDRVLKLVRDSLQGRDVAQAVQLEVESIERAKKIYESEQAEVERHLGQLDGMHREGPRMPKLQPTQPRLSEQRFTLGALEAGGGVLRKISESVWSHHRPGSAPEKVHFSYDTVQEQGERGFAGGPRVSVYAAGSPPFEQLVGQWKHRAAHVTTVAKDSIDTVFERSAYAWAAAFEGVSVVGTRVVNQRRVPHGRVVVRAATSVAHDKYEKLIDVSVTAPILREVEPVLEEDVGLVAVPLDLAGEVPEVELIIREGLRKDSDLESFNSFYLRRLEEEVQRSADAPTRERALVNFTPSVSAEVVGFQGSVRQLVEGTVEYTVDGAGPYVSQLVVLAGRDEPFEKPALERCAVTGRSLPSAAFASCEVTGARALDDQLVRSELSGRRAVPAQTVTCGESGRTLLSDEVQTCSLTGIKAAADLMTKSSVSGARFLARLAENCAFSGAVLTPAESSISQVSHRVMRRDQAVVGGELQVLGHDSEFVRCAITGQRFLPGELVASDVSGAFGRASLMQRSTTGRRGLPIEMRRCEKSGRQFLVDEVGVSAVSKRTFAKELLVKSSISDACALESELMTCEVTGARLLPSEGDRCRVTGKFVERRHLDSSDVSGVLALREMLTTCQVTGKRVLPSELVQCEESGAKALPEAMGRCAVTGKYVLRRLLIETAEPAALVLERLTSPSELTGERGVTADMPHCFWTGARLLARELKTCRLTQLSVTPLVLDEKGEIKGLRRFALRSTDGLPVPADEVAAIDWAEHGPAKKVSGVLRWPSSPAGLAVYRGDRSKLLGFASYTVLVVMNSGGGTVCVRVVEK